jgi:tRNA A37 threonylcarbamoyltransferase TsaD
VIQSSVIASQVDLHAQFGGVYPELASREHVKAINATVKEPCSRHTWGLATWMGSRSHAVRVWLVRWW